ncbi:MAG: NAD(P)H-hydrate dehydratase [Candidatus Micrarchaeia archaeon]|jgi:NAD(P)H-hydrate epimerase
MAASRKEVIQKTSAHLVRDAYPARKLWCSKGQFGKVLVVGGSREYTGSPTFNFLGAYAAGADLVTLLAPHRAADIAAAYAPEIIAPPLNCDYLEPGFVSEIAASAKNNHAMVIGGGLSQNQKTCSAVIALLSQIDLPVVVDADALRFIAENPVSFKNRIAILTPHAGELAALIGGESISPEDLGKRIDSVTIAAKKYSAVVLLKGAIDIIVGPKGNVMLDYQGSPYLTKGGHGDVLAGICGALLAKKLPAFEAAATAAYIYGKAGALAAKELGESTKPTDVLGKVPVVLKKLQ